MATQVTVQQALEHVAEHPDEKVDSWVDAPVWKLIARSLFVIANSPDRSRRGDLMRATRAQKLLFNRLVGTRRPGSNPVANKNASLTFIDLTAGELDG